MQKTIIHDSETIIHILQDEIRRSYEARCDHQLHAILLVAQGMSCQNVSELLGASPRSVAYRGNRFEAEVLAGLADPDRHGRPRWLDEQQIDQIQEALRLSPADYGLTAHL